MHAIINATRKPLLDILGVEGKAFGRRKGDEA
jgi:hypothetical protein